MKKILLILCLGIVSFVPTSAQCLFTCNTYSLTSINYSAFPTTGNTLTLSDDDLSLAIPIGFGFNYFCTTLSQVRVCSNGFITFDIFTPITLSLTPYAQSLPSINQPNGVIAYNWNDLDPSVGGSITYTTIGTTPNQIFIVSYNNVPIWNFGGSNSGQIVLYELNHTIEIHIKSAINNTWLTHTEGIEDLPASIGLPVPGRNLSLWSVNPNFPTAHRWSPYTITPPTSVTGNTYMCQGSIENYTVSPMPGATSYYWNLPPVWTGGGTSSVITGVAGTSGNISVAAVYTCGTSAPITLPITVVPGPLVSVSASPNVICSGKTVTVNGSGGAVSYTLNPTGINGLLPFMDTPGSSVVYTLVGTGTNNCISGNSATVSVLVKPTPTVTLNSGAICIGETYTLNSSGADNYTFSTVFNAVTPSVSGLYTYSVIGTDSTGCISNPAIATLTVNPLPTITIVATRTTICAKEPVSLTGFGGVSYYWSHNNATTSIVAVTPPGNSMYSIIGTDANGCINSGTISIKVLLCSGMEEFNGTKAEVRVYPNPSVGEFYIESPEFLSVIIYDMTGRIVNKMNLEAGRHTVNLKQELSGNYFLVTDTGNQRQKFVVVKE